MKTKGTKVNKINIITLGCSKNRVDSEVLLTQLHGNQLHATHESNDKSNIVVINTCGFIDRAKQESIDAILEYADKKAKGLVEKVFVTGCLSERYKDDLKNEIPEVDGYFGTMELPSLLNHLNADFKKELIGERLITTDSHYAYLKIAEGCDRPCSFCAIPLMRGGHVSRTMESLVTEATFLASKGVKELILIAQDLTYYGLDIYKKRELHTLLNKLSEIQGIEWIRLQYAYPSGFPFEILDVIRDNPKVCNYLDMPLQHISDNMLKSMRRGITEQKTKELIAKIRETVPGIAIRTTFIVGYPGETQEDFDALYDFVEQTKFERVGVFLYSHEENTHAHKLDDNISDETKEERRSDLMALQQDISFELNQQKIGNTYKVLIDRKEGEFYIGRTEYDSPEVDNEVLIKAKGLKIGTFVNVKIDKAEEFDLIGNVVE